MGESKKVIRETNLWFLWFNYEKTIMESYERQVKYKKPFRKIKKNYCCKIALIMYIFVCDEQYIVVKLPNHLKM